MMESKDGAGVNDRHETVSDNISVSTPGSFMSMVSSNGCLAKIIAPMAEVIALISSSSRSWNEVWMTVEYKEYNSLNLSAVPLF